jgi:hypothetical protein
MAFYRGGKQMPLQKGDHVLVDIDRTMTLDAGDIINFIYGGEPTPEPPKPWIVRQAWTLVKYARALKRWWNT